ncbi:MAG: undecaprenyl-diphosphate phosphatase [Betaproteobacteria bacterium]|nr:undecaprenyl-diphosphate phosphatase [Betaproteobacteria bacterium]
MELELDFLRDLPLLVKALIMGIVEGLTEFLPVSSTGHLILFGALLGFDDARAKVFDLAIQTGAMVAVMWNYRDRFIGIAVRELPAAFGKLPSAFRGGRDLQQWWADPQWQLSRHLLIAFIPAALLGLALGGEIKRLLFFPVPVAVVLIAGGFVIVAVERWCRDHPDRIRIHDCADLTNWDALKLGLAQAVALIPGTSRSGATIIGGMMFGLSRKTATEFSFFLAVPTLIAAGGYDLLRNRDLLQLADVPMFVVGLLSAYITALLVIRWLIRWVSQHSFNSFAIYRICAGIFVLAAVYIF